MQLTKELKTNWLTALKSGNYQQGPRQLYNAETHKHCCLGVLASIHPDLGIGESGHTCLYKGKNEGYKPFIDLFGAPKVEELYRANDSTYHKGARAYVDVIPLIESLPTID